MNLKVIISDVDGTLIEPGFPSSYPKGLGQAILSARRKGLYFSMASGRDLPYLSNLWHNITGFSEMKDKEALLYEDVCIRTGANQKYVLGGLNEGVIELIGRIEDAFPEYFYGLTELPGNKFTIRTARVSREFANGQKTDDKIRRKLEERYEQIKSLFNNLRDMNLHISSRLSNVMIRMSADSIDFVDKNANKSIAFEKYLDILKPFNIYAENILAIGDAENDEEMLKMALERGSLVGFVGANKKLELRLKEVNSNGNLIIPSQRGPLGTAELINQLLS